MPTSPPAVPPDLAASLAKFERSLQEDRRDLFHEAISQLAELPASFAITASGAIGWTAELWSIPAKTGRAFWFEPPPKAKPSATDLASTDETYAWLFLFHRNGRVRERALQSIQSAPISAFFFIALTWRLNDWAPQVREAALECARRVFPRTSASVVARAALVFLPRMLSWGRWTDEADVLNAATGRPDVLACLADILATNADGRLSPVLAATLKHPEIDRHLPRLATKAAQPTIRGTALVSLINRRADWVVGYEWVWIDKVYGLRKMKPTLQSRPIHAAGEPELYACVGLDDPSLIVRRRVADAIIKHRCTLRTLPALIDQMASDTRLSLRADFLRTA